MRTIFVVTHPEATHHREGIVGGWHDSDLTPRGQDHAQRIADTLAEWLSDSTQTELYTSDLLRAHRTADVIGTTLGLTPVAMTSLREKSYGMAEGQPESWLGERFTPPPATGDRLHHDEGVTGAETKADFATRLYGALDTILDTECRHQVVVTHGFALTFLIAAWIGMPIESAGYVNFRSSSGGITELHQDSFFHNRGVVRVNHTTHLEPR